MGKAPRRLVFGLVLLGAALGAGSALRGAEAATPGATAVVHGGVSATGAVTAPAGWRAVHLDTGRYRVQAPSDEADLDVATWDAAADVVIVPLGDGATEVRIRGDRGAVDADFAFTAIVRR